MLLATCSQSASSSTSNSNAFWVGHVKAYRRGKVWYLQYHENGIRRRPRVGPGRDAARRMAAQTNSQLETGDIAILSFEPVTIPDLRQRWLDHHEQVLRSSVQTIDRYRTATQHLLDFVAQVRPVRLVVEIATLKTWRLGDRTFSLGTPVSWSIDSGRLAFVPQPFRDLHVFNISQKTDSLLFRDAGERVEAMACSPDGSRIALFDFVNRRMDHDPLSLLSSFAGHPIFRNDGILRIYNIPSHQFISIQLQSGISEPSSPHVRIEWPPIR